MPSLPYALQLYSVRDYMEQDPKATLPKIKEMGYDHVELAGTYGQSAAEFKALLDATGLKPISMHCGYEELAGNLDKVIQDAKTLGIQYVVVPWLGSEVCPDKEAWLIAIQHMDKAGAQLRREELQLCYHNHDHEFERFDGQYIFDMIYSNTSPENLAVELDTCWSTFGGADTLALMKAYGTRVPLLHVKDYVRGDDDSAVFKELGRGCMNWDPIFEAAKACNVQWYVVEQDETDGDSLESAAISAQFMAKRQA